MNGVINVYKEKGYTSHDVVAKLRGILKQKKIGHTGTLDPQAEGVLPVCLGSATKLCDMLTDKTKQYRAIMRLGIVTDTQDLTGTVLREQKIAGVGKADITASSDAGMGMEAGEKELAKEPADANIRENENPDKPVKIDENELLKVMQGFVGKSEQIPPMYSAIKVNGKKLYELAREGKEVERKARPIEIFSLKVLDITLPDVSFEVECSKGTYIRTLCHDIGQVMGCGACMASLLRTRVERFHLKDALTLSQIEKLNDEGRLEEKIVSVEEMFGDLPKVVIKNEFKKRIDNGNSIPLHAVKESRTGESAAQLARDGARMRIYNEDGAFYGIYVYDGAQRQMKPEKMFL